MGFQVHLVPPNPTSGFSSLLLKSQPRPVLKSAMQPRCCDLDLHRTVTSIIPSLLKAAPVHNSQRTIAARRCKCGRGIYFTSTELPWKPGNCQPRERKNLPNSYIFYAFSQFESIFWRSLIILENLKKARFIKSPSSCWHVNQTPINDHCMMNIVKFSFFKRSPFSTSACSNWPLAWSMKSAYIMQKHAVVKQYHWLICKGPFAQQVFWGGSWMIGWVPPCQDSFLKCC